MYAERMLRTDSHAAAEVEDGIVRAASERVERNASQMDV